MIAFLKRHLSLPLLSRDLTQQSGRKITYILRVIMVLALMFVSWMLSSNYIVSNTTPIGPFQNLGIGGVLLEKLVTYLFVGIYILVPFICCSAIAQEKENDSLQLLMLTRLSPMAIILEKYFSRVLPIFLYLFCCLPILAYLYSLGGINADQIGRAFYALSLTILQVGALCIMCSAYSNSSMGAFLFSLLIGFLFYFSTGILSGIILHLVDTSARQTGGPGILFFPPSLFHQWGAAQGGNLFMLSIPTLLSILSFLLIAKLVLVRKVLVRPHNAIFNLFKNMDNFFNEWNKQYAGGMVLIDSPVALPQSEPIAWKEVRKTAIGTARYLIRVLLVLEFPTLFLCLIGFIDLDAESSIFARMILILTTIAVLLLISKTTDLISSERRHQTLEVVLATPISGREILLQKLKGVHRLWIVVMVPILTTIVFRSLMISNGNTISYFVLSIIFTVLTLYSIIWIALYFGLKQRRHSLAVSYALGTVAIWVSVPLILAKYEMFFWTPDLNFGYTPFFAKFSPLTVLTSIEKVAYTSFQAVPVEATEKWGLPYAALTCAIAFYFRHKCLRNADELLGRLSSIKKTEIVTSAANKDVNSSPFATNLTNSVTSSS